MKELLDYVSDNTLFIAILTAIMTFFLGRYTSRLDDYRQGRKDINETFYKPLMSLYMNEHHAYALYFVDLALEVQTKIVELLLENCNRVSPRVKEKIFELDQCYSGYKKALLEEEELLQEEKIYIEKCFNIIYRYIEKQYVKNERKLYCTFITRISYRISEMVLNIKSRW